MNKYPLKNFIELEGEPLVEALLLEELPKELARKIYGKDYISIGYFISNSLPEKTSIYNALRDDADIDVHKASFKKVEKEDFLQSIKTTKPPVGSIVYGEYKGASVILIYEGCEWCDLISIESNKIKRWNKDSIGDYFASHNITKQGLRKDIHSNGLTDIIQNKLDNVEIFICDGSPYERNFKLKTTSKVDSLQKEFNRILLDYNIDLDRVDRSVEDIFNIRDLSWSARYLVPSHLKDRYWA